MSGSARKKPELIEVEPQHVAVVRKKVSISELRDVFDRGFPAVIDVLERQSIEPIGPGLALYHGLPGDTVDVSVGFPTAAAIEAEGDVQPAMLPGGEVARLEHIGAYERLPQSYEQLQNWMADRMLLPGQTIWEVYVTEPAGGDPDALVTQLNWPVTERRSGGVEG